MRKRGRTVVWLCVCLSVCLSVCYQYICSPGEIQVLVYASTYVLNIILSWISICQIFDIKLGCGIIVRIHYLEASNEHWYCSEGNLLTVDHFTTWNFMYTTSVATGLKPGIAILQSLNYYTRCKFCAPPTSGLGMAVSCFMTQVGAPPFHVADYKVWSGYLDNSCVCV